MLGKYYKPSQPSFQTHLLTPKQSSPKRLQNKRSQEIQRKLLNRKVYGEHYNYNKVGLNKEKKYMLEEERNTQIERANRILLQKIKKIGQRSIQLNPINRFFLQQSPNNEQVERVSKIDNFYIRKQTPLRSTQHQLSQSSVSGLNSSRKTSLQESKVQQQKVLFRGNKEIDGIVFSMKIYIDAGMYIIYSQQANMHHKIQMTLQNYKLLFKESLEGNHSNIFNLLRFNGTLLELTGAKRHQVSILEEEQLLLPSVNKPSPAQLRFQTE